MPREHAAQHDADASVPVVDRVLGDRQARADDARVVVREVEPAVLAARRCRPYARPPQDRTRRVATKMASPPASRTSAAVRSPFSTSTSAATTRAPRSPNSRHVARPIPCAAPVTSATLPTNSSVMTQTPASQGHPADRGSSFRGARGDGASVRHPDPPSRRSRRPSWPIGQASGPGRGAGRNRRRALFVWPSGDVGHLDLPAERLGSRPDGPSADGPACVSGR